VSDAVGVALVPRPRPLSSRHGANVHSVTRTYAAPQRETDICGAARALLGVVVVRSLGPAAQGHAVWPAGNSTRSRRRQRGSRNERKERA